MLSLMTVTPNRSIVCKLKAILRMGSSTVGNKTQAAEVGADHERPAFAFLQRSERVMNRLLPRVAIWTFRSAGLAAIA